MAERIVNGFRLRRGGHDNHKKAVRWCVENVNLRVTAGNCGYSRNSTRENGKNADIYIAVEKLPADTRTYPQTEQDATNQEGAIVTPKPKFRRDFR